MASQIVHTICVDTRDAENVDEGQFTMQLRGDNPRLRAVKLALGSLEFPMVQWTIEKEWNRIYYSEGYEIQQDLSFLRIEEITPSTQNEINFTIPLHLNSIKTWSRRSEWLQVTTTYPHGLWVNGRKSVLHAISWGEVEIICSPFGRISLTTLQATGKLVYTSSTEFLIPNTYGGDVIEGFSGYVHVPKYPSPHHLCNVINHILLYSITLTSPHLEYNAQTNVASLLSSMYPPEESTLVLRLYGSKLAVLLGYRSPLHERRFVRPPQAALLTPRTVNGFGVEDTQGDQPPLILRSEAFGGWSFVEIEPGWYSPSHRPMCTGTPLRLAQEMEYSLNRLYFPLTERVPQGMPTSHFLMFTDPLGVLHNCPVFIGRYSPQSLSKLLESGMTRLASRSLPGTTFTVEYDTNTAKFTFACEVKTENFVESAPFSLIFHHPLQFDPARIGFAPVQLHGSDHYTSAYPVHLPSTGHPANIYKVAEVGHQKRLRIHSVPISQITGIITAYDALTNEMTVRTHVGQLPFANGLRSGDIVRIGPTDKHELYTQTHDNDHFWEPNEYDVCPVEPSWVKSGVVMQSEDSIHVRIKVRNADRLGEHMNTVVSIQCDVQPFNLSFSLPKSIDAAQLGFRPGVVQWGIDGSVSAYQNNLPPFDAPNVHSLDHPDYVLMYIDEGKKSTTLQHTYGQNNSVCFAKLVLYPMFREERMLPRDTSIMGGESLSRFTVRFTNPNGTPYHFHGVNFSFSLNLIQSQ